METERDEPNEGLADTLELIRSAQAGRHEALEELFARYYPELHRMVRPMLGAGLRRFLESGDVLGEALYDVIRDFDRFEITSREKFLALMRRVVENRILNEARYRRADKRASEREQALQRLSDSCSSGRLSLDLESSGPSPGTQAERAEESRALQRALVELPDRTRTVLRLRYEDGCTWKEIARRTGFPSEDAARMHFARAHIELRERVLGGSDDGHDAGSGGD